MALCELNTNNPDHDEDIYADKSMFDRGEHGRVPMVRRNYISHGKRPLAFHWILLFRNSE
jgi:hypothetical protein